MLIIRSRKITMMLEEAFAELRSQRLDREQRASIDEIALAASILADLPTDSRRAAVAALVELGEQDRPPPTAVFFVD